MVAMVVAGYGTTPDAIAPSGGASTTSLRGLVPEVEPGILASRFSTLR